MNEMKNCKIPKTGNSGTPTSPCKRKVREFNLMQAPSTEINNVITLLNARTIEKQTNNYQIHLKHLLNERTHPRH